MGTGVRIETNAEISDNGLKGLLTINNPNYKNSDKSLITSFEATQIDNMSRFGYKSSKTGFSLGTSFEQYEDVYFSPEISNYFETLKTSSKASAAKKKQKGNYIDSNFNYWYIIFIGLYSRIRKLFLFIFYYSVPLLIYPFVYFIR